MSGENIGRIRLGQKIGIIVLGCKRLRCKKPKIQKGNTKLPITISRNLQQPWTDKETKQDYGFFKDISRLTKYKCKFRKWRWYYSAEKTFQFNWIEQRWWRKLLN